MALYVLITQPLQGTRGACGDTPGTLFPVYAQIALLRYMPDQWSVNNAEGAGECTAPASDAGECGTDHQTIHFILGYRLNRTSSKAKRLFAVLAGKRKVGSAADIAMPDARLTLKCRPAGRFT